MLSKSIDERLVIANSLRKQSKEANKEKGEDIMDVNTNEIEKMIKDYEPNIIIHGHTHRPNIHHHGQVVRYVLGDWYNRFLYYHSTKKNLRYHKGIKIIYHLANLILDKYA